MDSPGEFVFPFSNVSRKRHHKHNNKRRQNSLAKLPYAGKRDEMLVNNCVKKLNSLFSEKIRFIICYDTTKLSQYCSNKDPAPALQRANVIYKLVCPGCTQQYIGKTDRSLAFRLCEHARREEQPMYKHLSNCENFKETVSLCAELPNLYMRCASVNFKEHIFNAVHTNFEIIDSNDNLLQLALLEAF